LLGTTTGLGTSAYGSGIGGYGSSYGGGYGSSYGGGYGSSYGGYGGYGGGYSSGLGGYGGGYGSGMGYGRMGMMGGGDPNQKGFVMNTLMTL
jgi:peroxin-13